MHLIRRLIGSHSILLLLRSRGPLLLNLFLLVVLPLYVFGELAEDINEHEGFAFDHKILLFMYANANAYLDAVMLFFSKIGSRLWLVPIGVLIFVFLASRRRWIDALFWGLSVGGAALLNFFAKHTFERPRPDLWVSIAPETTFSFPSGHAMHTMAFAGAVIVLLWTTKFRLPAVVLGGLFVLFVGVSRVYLGVHYPSDILAGWTASIAWVFGLNMILYGRIKSTNNRTLDAKTIKIQ